MPGLQGAALGWPTLHQQQQPYQRKRLQRACGSPARSCVHKAC